MAQLFSPVLTWRPSGRELLLLRILGGIVVAAWLWSAYTSMVAAQAEHGQASERLGRARLQFARLSDSGALAAYKDQTGRLAGLTMRDPTVQLSELRMREELTELAVRAGLVNVVIEDVARPFDGLTQPVAKTGFVAVSMTLEANFDWAGFARLLRELEQFYRGYLIDGVAVRSDGDRRRLRVSLRILHQTGEFGR